MDTFEFLFRVVLMDMMMMMILSSSGLEPRKFRTFHPYREMLPSNCFELFVSLCHNSIIGRSVSERVFWSAWSTPL